MKASKWRPENRWFAAANATSEPHEVAWLLSRRNQQLSTGPQRRRRQKSFGEYKSCHQLNVTCRQNVVCQQTTITQQATYTTRGQRPPPPPEVTTHEIRICCKSGSCSDLVRCQRQLSVPQQLTTRKGSRSFDGGGAFSAYTRFAAIMWPPLMISLILILKSPNQFGAAQTLGNNDNVILKLLAPTNLTTNTTTTITTTVGKYTPILFSERELLLSSAICIG